MKTKLSPVALVLVLLLALGAAAVPLYRWFVAPVDGRVHAPPARAFKGTMFQPVAVELVGNPRAPGAPRTVGDVQMLPVPAERYVPLPDTDRKAIKKDLDAYLKGLGVPMDSPTMATGRKPNALGVNIRLLPVRNGDGTITITAELGLSQGVYARNDGSDAFEATVWRETAEGRVTAADLQKGLRALAESCLNGAVKRWRDDNGPG